MDYNTINFIKKSLDYYDNQLEENKQYLENTKFTFKISKEGPLTQHQYIIFKNNKVIKNGNYQLLGYFDYQTKIFITAWSLMMVNTDYIYNSLSRELFDVVYKMQQSITVNDDEQYDMLQYIHNQLNNSSDENITNFYYRISPQGTNPNLLANTSNPLNQNAGSVLIPASNLAVPTPRR